MQLLFEEKNSKALYIIFISFAYCAVLLLFLSLTSLIKNDWLQEILFKGGLICASLALFVLALKSIRFKYGSTAFAEKRTPRAIIVICLYILSGAIVMVSAFAIAYNPKTFSPAQTQGKLLQTVRTAVNVATLLLLILMPIYYPILNSWTRAFDAILKKRKRGEIKPDIPIKKTRFFETFSLLLIIIGFVLFLLVIAYVVLSLTTINNK